MHKGCGGGEMYSMYFLNNLKLLCLQRKRTIIRIVVRSFISFFLWYWTYSTWENDNQTLLQVLEMMTIITRLPHFMCYKFLLYQYWYICSRLLRILLPFFLWNLMLIQLMLTCFHLKREIGFLLNHKPI